MNALCQQTCSEIFDPRNLTLTKFLYDKIACGREECLKVFNETCQSQRLDFSPYYRYFIFMN